MHGQFVWYELTTPDPAASMTFYPRFTNWGTQPFNADYTTFTSNGQPVAGIFRQTAEMKANGIPPNWMPYVEVDDVDATASSAKSLGATVMAGPDDIPNTGRFAVIQDPQGAVFGIYKSFTQSSPWDGKNVVGRFSWHELMTSDHLVAAKFYNALFGWQKISEMDMGNGEMYYVFGLNGAMYGGMFTTPKEMAGMHPFWLVYIHVNDVAEAVQIATKNGATIHRPQMEIPGGSIAILGDPQGAGFAVHHAAARPARAVKTATKAVAAVTAVVKKAAAKVQAIAKKAKPKRKAAPRKKAAPAKRSGARKASAPGKRSGARKTSAPRKRSAPRRKSAPTRTTGRRSPTKSRPAARRKARTAAGRKKTRR
ncbi:MAG TPA: VOC family protein [Gemmatimonadaceae bacterium]